MEEKEIEAFIRKELVKGTSPEILKKALTNIGHNPALVDRVIESEKALPPKAELFKSTEENVMNEELAMPSKPQEKNVDKRFLVLASTLAIIIIVLSLGYFFISPGSGNNQIKLGIIPTYDTLKSVNIDTNKLSIVSSNPDLVFTGYDWGQTNGYELSDSSFSSYFQPWYGDGFYVDRSVPEGSDKNGVVIIHPVDETTPRYMAQDITLPGNADYYLVAEVADIADYVNKPCSDSCSDGIVKIEITSPTSKGATFEKVLNSKDGWQTLKLDISKYAGKSITFKVKGYAGGPCGNWCGEWMGVNKFYIGKL